MYHFDENEKAEFTILANVPISGRFKITSVIEWRQMALKKILLPMLGLNIKN